MLRLGSEVSFDPEGERIWTSHHEIIPKWLPIVHYETGIFISIYKWSINNHHYTITKWIINH
jgi:hypothetical protein